jgi:serine/threonine protein phosphatase PrpC
LGDFAFKHPEALLSVEPHVATQALTPDDRLVLLATDGVTDVLSDEAVFELALTALEQVSVY